MGIDIITKAINYAIDKHNDQEFINNHTVKVFSMVDVLVEMNDNIPEEDKVTIRAATWLHDLLEDTDVTYLDLVKEFGEDIANLVVELTDNGVRNTFPNLVTKYAILIKYCDRVVNLSNRTYLHNTFACDDNYFMNSIFWKMG